MNRTLLTVVVVASFGAAATAQAAGDVAAGKTKAAACAGCHGANDQGGPAQSSIGRQAGGSVRRSAEGLQIGQAQQSDHENVRSPAQ